MWLISVATVSRFQRVASSPAVLVRNRTAASPQWVTGGLRASPLNQETIAAEEVAEPFGQPVALEDEAEEDDRADQDGDTDERPDQRGRN